MVMTTGWFGVHDLSDCRTPPQMSKPGIQASEVSWGWLHPDEQYTGLYGAIYKLHGDTTIQPPRWWLVVKVRPIHKLSRLRGSAIDVVDLASMCWHDTKGSGAKFCPLPDRACQEKLGCFYSLCRPRSCVVQARRRSMSSFVIGKRQDMHHMSSGNKTCWNITKIRVGKGESHFMDSDNPQWIRQFLTPYHHPPTSGPVTLLILSRLA